MARGEEKDPSDVSLCVEMLLMLTFEVFTHVVYWNLKANEHSRSIEARIQPFACDLIAKTGSLCRTLKLKFTRISLFEGRVYFCRHSGRLVRSWIMVASETAVASETPLKFGYNRGAR